MVFFKYRINYNSDSSSQFKYIVECPIKKCGGITMVRDIYFCSYECDKCGRKLYNPEHAKYHSKNKCYYHPLKPDTDKFIGITSEADIS